MTEKKSTYVSLLKENRTREQAEDIYNQRIDDSREVFEKFGDQFYHRQCPVCGASDETELEKFDNRYRVVKCATCASNYVNPCPTLSALDYYYNECACNRKSGDLLKSRVGKKGVILTQRTKLVLEIIKSKLLENEKITVLDIGCNSGAFLHELSEALFAEAIYQRVSLVGIDIDKNAVDNPVSDSIDLFHSSAESFVSGRASEFDLILYFELIEHLSDPYSFITAVRDLLKDGGATYFHTPNALGFDNQALGYSDFRPLAHGIFPPMHLQAFTTQNIAHFLIRADLKVGEISTPGNFDIDMVKQFLPKNANSDFSEIHNIDDEYVLAVIQSFLRRLSASSHLAVLAYK